MRCTKIAAKLARTSTDRHGLRDLCRDLLGVEISKQQQTSDWGAPELSAEQMAYAAADVLHLHALCRSWRHCWSASSDWHWPRPASTFCRPGARLDLLGWDAPDIFAIEVLRLGGSLTHLRFGCSRAGSGPM